MSGFNLFEAGSLPSPIPHSSGDVQTALAAQREIVAVASFLPEQEAVQHLMDAAIPADASHPAILELAGQLIAAMRKERQRGTGVDMLMQAFPLSSAGGLALMGLAEALLRIPDKASADLLIADKLAQANWQIHAHRTSSRWVSSAAYSLAFARHLTNKNRNSPSSFSTSFIRHAAISAMRQLGEQFVCGKTVEEALRHSRHKAEQGYRYSYDMLGEAALTDEDASRHYHAYETALHAIANEEKGLGLHERPGISVKLSALHPRYAYGQHERVMMELLPRLKQLMILAKKYGVGLTIDAEEADRLELSLDLIEALAFDPDLHGFDGMGIVVQAYQKRCFPLIGYLAELARFSKRRLMVRLVKGAYWDSEIKVAQVDGLSEYPVYTRKAHTDVSYLVCAQKLLASCDTLYPQFATHNAHTVATLIHWTEALDVADYEFQCLYGMGEALYDQIVGKSALNRQCRIYTPVGPHSTLLPYLARRLLENGANSSFVNQLLDKRITLDHLLADPFEATRRDDGKPHPAIPLPPHLFPDDRLNSRGYDLSSQTVLHNLRSRLEAFSQMTWHAVPLIGDALSTGAAKAVTNPAHRIDIIGFVTEAEQTDIDAALNVAAACAHQWQNRPVKERAECLRQAADLFSTHDGELIALIMREAGKTLSNAIAEVREAVDFLRYYASQAEKLPPASSLGVVACISPWNFPLAIFTGQVSAALAAGNAVIAKPAEQTPLVAFRAVQLMHEAGIPVAALQYLPGQGSTVGEQLIHDARIRGVVFTGSTEVARHIHQVLIQRAGSEGWEIPLIAETGGQNAMIVDTTALTEQVVQDVLSSAFDSAGQRCSALRVLCLQEEIADRTITMLKGAMRELSIGNPAWVSTDIGPVIDPRAQQGLQTYIDRWQSSALQVFQLPSRSTHESGSFVMPALIEISSLSQLNGEVFGPVLHVLRYRRESLPSLIETINTLGYGLTMGVHSRINKVVETIRKTARVGNLYVNRSMIGAVVGIQPFGGEGLSGTGPKTGGPFYLLRLVNAELQAQPEGLRHGTNAVEIPAAFSTLLDWCYSRHPDIAFLASPYRELSLLGKEIQLPGPAGEINILTFEVRGRILCAASTLPLLLHQMLAVLASGNHIVLLSSSAALLPPDLPGALLASMTVRDDVPITDIDAVLADIQLAASLRPQTAHASVAIVPVIEVQAGQAIALWRLFKERTVSINIAAAGGNANLATLQPSFT